MRDKRDGNADWLARAFALAAIATLELERGHHWGWLFGTAAAFVSAAYYAHDRGWLWKTDKEGTG